jgi:hypothetical protein
VSEAEWVNRSRDWNENLHRTDTVFKGWGLDESPLARPFLQPSHTSATFVSLKGLLWKTRLIYF